MNSPPEIQLSFDKAIALAMRLRQQQKFEQAKSIADQLLRTAKAGNAPDSVLSRLNKFLSTVHAGRGNLAQATAHMDAAFWMDATEQRGIFNDLVRLYRLNGQTDKIPRAMDAVLGPRSDRPTRRQNLVFALPKSAGTSVCSSVAGALGTGHFASGFDLPTIPHYSAAVLGPQISRRVGTNRIIHQTHAMPWPENIKVLRDTAKPKFLVHVRDPRPAVLSYYHMGDAAALHRLRLILAIPTYNQMSAEDRFAKVVELVFPMFIEWLNGWVDYVDQSEGSGMITSFEEFKADPNGLVRRITGFLAGEEREPTTIYKTHFRKGSNDAPDPLLTEALRQELFEKIPEGLRTRFGWTV